MATSSLLNLDELPHDPIKRLLWLSGVRQQAEKELDEAFGRAYFEARQQGRMPTAISLGIHSRKRCYAYTRAENERTGRQWRWNGN